jgi:hypothetical protein
MEDFEDDEQGCVSLIVQHPTHCACHLAVSSLCACPHSRARVRRGSSLPEFASTKVLQRTSSPAGKDGASPSGLGGTGAASKNPVNVGADSKGKGKKRKAEVGDKQPKGGDDEGGTPAKKKKKPAQPKKTAGDKKTEGEGSSKSPTKGGSADAGQVWYLLCAGEHASVRFCASIGSNVHAYEVADGRREGTSFETCVAGAVGKVGSRREFARARIDITSPLPLGASCRQQSTLQAGVIKVFRSVSVCTGQGRDGGTGW